MCYIDKIREKPARAENRKINLNKAHTGSKASVVFIANGALVASESHGRISSYMESATFNSSVKHLQAENTRCYFTG